MTKHRYKPSPGVPTPMHFNYNIIYTFAKHFQYFWLFILQMPKIMCFKTGVV